MRLIWSMNSTPGSAQSHVDRMMASHSARGVNLAVVAPAELQRETASRLCSAACMNSSVIATDVLKPVNLSVLFLA
jgi:hypothetical protein